MLLRKVGRAPDTRSHSEALRALGRAEQTAAALKILHEMTSSGPSPDVWCYSEVLKALARTENLGGALAVFEEMNERGVAPNVWCCNSLVTVLCKAGRMREARGVLEAMRRCGRAVGEGSVNTPSRGSVNMPSGVSVDAPSGERGGTETSGSETAEQVGSSEHVGHLHATGVGQSTERRDFMAGFSGKWVTVSDDVTEEKGRGAGKRGEGGHTLAGKASGNNEGIEVATSSGGILQERSVRVPSVMRLRETYTVETGSPGAASVTGSGKDVEAVVAGGVGSQPAMADVSIRAHADVSAPAGEDDRLSAADDVSMLSRHPAAIGSSGGGGTGFEGVRESGREDVSAARTDGNGKTFGAGQLSGVSLNTQTGTSPEVLTEGASLREQILEADWEGKGGAQATSNRDDLGNEENVARSSWESNDLEVLRRAMLGKRPTDLGASALAGSEIETRSFSEGDHPDDVQSKGLQENCNIRLDNEPSLERGEKALGVDRGEGRDFCVEGIDKDGSVSESVGGVSGPGVGGSQQHGRIPAVGAQSDGPEVGGQRDSRKATLAESDGSGAGIETESRKDTLAQSDGSGADIETDSRNGTLTNERYEQREGRSKETSGDSPGPARLEPVLPKADVRNGVQSKADVRRALQQCLRWGAEWPATWPPPPAPDAVTYNVLIGASANESDGWRSAVELLDCMRTDGVAPTQITYNAVSSFLLILIVDWFT